MKAIILAAGRGSRMGDHTDNCPKPMISFLNKRLYEWQVLAFEQAGINEITVVGGYLSEQWDQTSLEKRTNFDWASTNMIATLFCARDMFDSDQSLIVSYGDIIFEPQVLEKLVVAPGDIVVTVDKNWRSLWEERFEDPLLDAESLQLDGTGAILEIGQTISQMNQAEAQFIGLMKFSPAGQKAITEFYDQANNTDTWMNGRTKKTCYSTDFLQGMIENGQRIDSSIVEGGWLEFDSGIDFDIYTRLAAANSLQKFINIESFET